ncbi:MAG: M20/M25/M40 family metallo-hydrolase, partial [Planctomycetota bacterium]
PGFWARGMRDDRTLLAHWVGRVPRDYFLGAKVNFTALPAESETPGPPVVGRVTRVCEYRGEGDHARVEIEVDAPVCPGAIGQWALPPAEVVDGRIHATAIDDVAGAAALLCVLKELVATGSPRPVCLLFTRAEEAGFVGCIGYCRDQLATGRRGAQQIVGIEMSKAMPGAPVGGGPVVRVGDRRSVFDPGTTDDGARAGDRLCQQDPAFRYQRKLMDGGTCESSVFQSYLGRSGAVCLPLGNYHNVDEQNRRIDREFIDVQDFHGLVRLLLEIVESPVSPAEPDAAQPLIGWCDGLWDRHHHLLFEPASAPKGNAS